MSMGGGDPQNFQDMMARMGHARNPPPAGGGQMNMDGGGDQTAPSPFEALRDRITAQRAETTRGAAPSSYASLGGGQAAPVSHQPLQALQLERRARAVPPPKAPQKALVGDEMYGRTQIPNRSVLMPRQQGLGR